MTNCNAVLLIIAASVWALVGWMIRGLYER